MPHGVNLGNIVNYGNKTILGGVASNLDSKKLIENLEEVRKKPIKDIEDKVDINDKKVQAYHDFKAILKTFQVKAEALRNIPSYNINDNAFLSRQSSGTTNDVSSWDNYIKVTPEAGAHLTQNKFHITSLATAKMEQIGSSGTNLVSQVGFSSKTNSITTVDGSGNTFKAGTFQINGQDITLEENNTLIDIAAKINYKSSEAKVKADIIQVNSSDFRLRLTSTETGIDNAYNITDANDVLASLSKVSLSNTGRIKQIGTTGSSLDSQTGFTSKTTSVTTIDGNGNTFKAGTFQINGEDIKLEVGDTLIDVVIKTNEKFAGSSVRADIIEVDTNDFRLRLTSAKEGSTPLNIVDTDDVLATLSNVADFHATDATFSMDGINFTRANNDITDVIDKVKFTLREKNSATDKHVTVKLEHDYNKIRTAIYEFVTAYNGFMQFVAKQNRIDEKTNILAEDSYLGKETVFKNIIFNIQKSIKDAIIGLPSDKIDSLWKIGFKLETIPANEEDKIVKAPNSLTLDVSTLDKYLESNLDDVKKIFELNAIAPEHKIKIGERTNLINISDFTIKIKTPNLDSPFNTEETAAIVYKDENGNDIIEYADFTASSAPSTGNLRGTIKGRARTKIEGLEIVYFGSTTNALDEIDVKLTQGISDKVFILIKPSVANLGPIDQAIEAIKSQNSRFKNNIESMNAKLERDKNTQLNNLARLERQAAAVNSSLLYLDAMANAQQGKK